MGECFSHSSNSTSPSTCASTSTSIPENNNETIPPIIKKSLKSLSLEGDDNNNTGTNTIPEMNLESNSSISSKNKFAHKTIIDNFEDDHRTMKKLENIDNDLPCYTLKDQILMVKVTNVHDGDTVTTTYYPQNSNVITSPLSPSSLSPKASRHQNFLMKRPCRLYGLDTPEVGGRTSDHEKRAGNLVGTWLRNYIKENTKNQNNVIWIRFMHEEKFGRDMGILYLKNPKLFHNHLNPDNQDEKERYRDDKVEDEEKMSEKKKKKKKKITLKQQSIENMKGSINQILIDKKFAKPYFGDKKEKWTSKELTYIINTLSHTN